MCEQLVQFWGLLVFIIGSWTWNFTVQAVRVNCTSSAEKVWLCAYMARARECTACTACTVFITRMRARAHDRARALKANPYIPNSMHILPRAPP